MESRLQGASRVPIARAAEEAERVLQHLRGTPGIGELAVAHGLDAARLQRHTDAIERLNRRLHGITLLKGIEVDILDDGSLDLPDAALSQLDLVVGAVHSRFDLPRDAQTRRLLRALEHRYFTILAHPGGRLIGERPAMDFDMSTVIAAARRRGCFLELNAQPQRLDLDDVYCREAKAQGVLLSIDADAHSTSEFANLRFGIGQARRGWLEPGDVLNTRPLAQLLPLLRNCYAQGRGARGVAA